MNRTLYDDLGVKKQATKLEISKAYKNLAKKYHPDLQTNEKAKKKAEKEMIKINIAYETLKDDVKRREYDNQLLAEEEAIRLVKERARQEAAFNNIRNYNQYYNQNNNSSNNQNYEIRYVYVNRERRINYDILLKVLLAIGIFSVIIGIAMVIPASRDYILDLYENNIIVKIIINILVAIKSAFKSTMGFIKQNIGKRKF